MKVFATLLFQFSFFFLMAQIDVPLASPHSVLQQRVGLTDITVDYHRPSKRGRQVMGNLIPYGRIWRVGANESTKVTFSDDVSIEGNKIPAGTYALYAFPEKQEWIIVIHKNISHWGDGRSDYNPKEDLVRFNIKTESMCYLQESFLIEFEAFTHNSAQMIWLWENTRISFLIVVDTDKKMMAQIEQAINGNPTADTYYQSARYLQEENKDHERALRWLAKANELAGNKYYIHRVWSLVLAQAGDYRQAIQHATLSKELAAIEGKDEFVRMNESSIRAWEEVGN